MANRRNFLKAAGIGVVAASIPSMAVASNGKDSASKKKYDYRLGIASYSLRKFDTEKALDMAVRCGVNRITFKDMHLPLDADKET
ncbi:MAG TPA: twin-arginine translocation signal domain-containing protein, partial [Mariniphaga sp.]|nr:twin-arginine translocation signal domain-containing protein [Mariniphaga sp.]